MYVCMYVCMCIYIYTYIKKNSSSLWLASSRIKPSRLTRAVSGLMAGPQLQLVLRCSQMAAPLDALPYWAEPRLATPWQPLPKAMGYAMAWCG